MRIEEEIARLKDQLHAGMSEDRYKVHLARVYSSVLKEIARRDCIDPLSLARAALLAEAYEAERHE
jgi:hypothetical protein